MSKIIYKSEMVGGQAIGIPIGSIIPFSSSSTLPNGFLACEGQAISRTMYKDLFQVIGTIYGEGDGNTTFNIPNLSSGEFLEGSTVAGVSKSAGLPNIEGSARNSGFGVIGNANGDSTGAFTAGPSPLLSYPSGGSGNLYSLTLDASRSSEIYGASDTVQPKSVTVHYIIKAFDDITPNSALLDVTQYASDLANRASRSLDSLTPEGEDHFLEQDFTIIYPNGGSEGNPANVTTNSRYVETNPFPGYAIACVLEVKYNNEWGRPGSLISEWGNGSQRNFYRGVDAIQLNDNNIIIQTATDSIMSPANHGLAPFNNSDHVTTLPCRVKVWKIGKVVRT